MRNTIDRVIYGTLLAGCLLFCVRGAMAAEDENRLAELLQSPQTSLEQKDAICQKLRISGSARIIPALAALLADENLSQSARLALAPMSFPEAGQALRDALSRTAGKTKAGIIDSLGDRRERESATAIAGLVQDADATIATSAATALGKIGGSEAIAALQAARAKATPALRTTIADGLLLCADGLLASGESRAAERLYREIYDSEKLEHLRVAAYRGLILASGDEATSRVVTALQGTEPAAWHAAIQLVLDVKGEAATKAFAATLTKVSPPVQIAILQSLARRGDKAAAPAVVELIRSADPQVRRTALAALAVLGDASHAALLAQTAARTSGPDQEAARESLALLRDDSVRDALLTSLRNPEPAVQGEIVRALGQRQETQAVPALLTMARNANDASRVLALKSLALLANSAQAGDLIGLVISAKTDGERAAAEQALMASCGRGDRPESCVPQLVAAMKNVNAAGGASVPARSALLRVAGRLGGAEALKALRVALIDPEPVIQDVALRTLAEFAGLDAADDLLKLSKDLQRSASQRVLALRGYWRVVGLAGDQSVDEQWRLCEAGMAASQRPEEKRLGLAELAKIPHINAFKLAQTLCDDPAVRDEAEATCVRLAAALVGSYPAEAKAALTRLEKDAASATTRTEAHKAIETINQYVGFITVWSYAGPYRQSGKQCQELFNIPFPPEDPNAKVAWKPVPPSADPSLSWQADLLKFTGGDQCVLYVKSRVWSPREQKVQLSIGSDDGNRIWVNGTLVHSNNTLRPIQAGSDTATANLKQGWNDFLIKVTQNNMGCAVCVRIRNSDGSIIEGLRFEAGQQQ